MFLTIYRLFSVKNTILKLIDCRIEASFMCVCNANSDWLICLGSYKYELNQPMKCDENNAEKYHVVKIARYSSVPVLSYRVNYLF